MKLTPDDPRLSAYLLGELDSEEAALVERAAASDPAIRMSLDDLEKTAGFLEDVFGEGGEHGLFHAQRETVLRAARNADVGEKTVALASAGRRNGRVWWSAIGAAAAVAFAALLASRIPREEGSGQGAADGRSGGSIELLPMPGPDGGIGEVTGVANRAGGASEIGPRENGEPRRDQATSAEPSFGGALPGFSKGPESRLPVVVGTSSHRLVGEWIREKRQLPPRDAVRVEELVNACTLDGGSRVLDVRLTVEAASCPWNESSTIVAVQIQTVGESPVNGLEIRFRSDRERRILGTFAPGPARAVQTDLPAGRSTLVMLELRGEGDPGVLEIRRGNLVRTRSIPTPDRAASPEFRHALAMAGFGLWLRDEGVGANDVAKCLEAAKGDRDPVRMDTRHLVREALDLAETGH